MSGISQKFSAVINFGASISASWGRSVRDIEGGLRGAGKQTERMTNEQKKLAAEIRRAKLAGRNVDELTQRYKRLQREIRESTEEQARLDRLLRRRQQLDRFRGAGRGLLGRAAGVGGQIGSMVAPGLAIGGGGLVASTLGALIAPAAINARTSEKVGLARQYGVDSETYNMWDSMARQVGLTGENIGDLYDEYQKKAGEFKQTGEQGSLQDAYETLGYGKGALRGLNGPQQFNKIIEDALKLDDSTKAGFALDSLFGGEASKFLMTLKMSGKTLKETTDEQRRYNLVTERGARGALESNQNIQNLSTVMESAVAEISGQLGEELSPDIRKLTDDLAEWFRGGGISKITRFLKNDLYPGVITFGSGVVFVGKIIYALAKKLSWLLPDEQQDKRAVLSNLADSESIGIARLVANKRGVGEWFDQQIKDDPQLLEKVKQAKKDSFGTFMLDSEKMDQRLNEIIGPEEGNQSFNWRAELDKNRKLMAAEDSWPELMQKTDVLDTGRTAPQLNDNRKNTYHFVIYAKDEQSGSQIADEVVKRAESNDFFNNGTPLYDKGDVW